jgi:hypothetical protein
MKFNEKSARNIFNPGINSLFPGRQQQLYLKYLLNVQNTLKKIS